MAQTKKLSPGIMLVTLFFTLFAVNALTIMLANTFFPQNIVLGTLHISPVWAIILSGTFFTLIRVIVIPFVDQYQANRSQKLSGTNRLLTYFAVNFIGLWLVSRAAHVLGFGISSFVVALVLAAVLTFFQNIAISQLSSAGSK